MGTALRARVEIEGIGFDPISLDGAVDELTEVIEAGRSSHVVTANLDYLRMVRDDVELGSILDGADLVVADGVPVLWLARFNGRALPGRVNGTDLVVRLLELAGARGWRVAFVGGDPGVAEAAAAAAQARWGVVSSLAVGPSPAEVDDPVTGADLAASIAATGTQLLLLGISAGRQQRFIETHRAALGACVGIGCGSALDYVAGTRARAPRWMQRAGLEWAWRLGAEPRRLARRYLVDDLPVLVRGVARRLRAGVARP